ncbi:hypothetical protein ACF0H5_023992 [Mactra antiquata]
MAFSGSILKTSEETFDFICTSCAEDNLIKEGLKYCVECQKYCCKDCLTYHKRFALLKGHSFLDNSSVKPQGQPRSLPAFPTKQCSQHIGKIMDMFCKAHDVVCCYVCVAEDHVSCKDMMSVSDNINRLYNKTDTSRATYKLGYILDDMNQWKANTDTLLKQLRDSKTTAIKAISDYRIEMEKFLKKLEEASIKEIEDQYQTLESQILAERQRYEDSIDELKNLKQLLTQASGNIAQRFVCSKLAEKKCTTLGDDEMKRKTFKHAEVKFVPSEQLKSSIEKMKNLGETSAISSRMYNLYKVTKICDMKVRLKEDTSEYNWIYGSCIIDDTVIFTDCENNKLKRFDISSSSLIDYCKVPDGPLGVCRVGEREVAVACWDRRVQFVSIHNKLSLLRSIQMNHVCCGIAYSNDKLYITDRNKSLYMYDMSGNILKTVTSDNSGQPIFERSRLITFNDKKDRLFVGDVGKGLVCFNAECDYIETVTDSDVRPHGVCTDGYGNVIVANCDLHTIVQCSRDGQKCGIIVNKTRVYPVSVSIHHGLRKMFVGYFRSDTVEVYNLTWKSD